MRTKTLTLVLVAVLLVSPVVVSAASNPQFKTFVPEPTLTPGETQSLTIQLVNDGDDPTDRVETASDVRVTVKGGDTPIEVHSGTQRLGTMADGRTVPVTVRLEVPANVPGGTYRLPLELTYYDPDDLDERERKTVYATVRVQDRPRFVVESVDSAAPVGGTGTVTLEVTNVGEEPASASALSLSATSPDVRFNDAPSASRYAGEWRPNETRSLSYEVTFSEDAEVRSYALSAVVEYEDNGTDRRSSSMRVGVTPLPEQTFSVDDVESSLYVGEDGALSGTVTNTGERVVENAVVVVESTNPNVQPTVTEYAVGRLAPGQSESFSFEMAVAKAAEAGPRQFSFRVQYRAPDDSQRVSDAIDERVRVNPPRERFAVRNLTSSLRVGDEGTIRGTVRNDGDERVENVVLQFQTTNPNVNALEPEIALGALAPGETETFVYDVEVSSAAESGPRQFAFAVEYDDGSETKQADPVKRRVRIGPKQDEFDVAPIQAQFSPGESGQMVVEITNTREEPLSKISAKLFVDSPVSASDDEAFVDELGPGETTRLTFGVSVGGGAIEKVYPVKMDFRYETSDGDTRISDTYQVPVRVAGGGGGGLNLPLVFVGVGVLAVVAGAGYFLYRRR